MSSKSESLRRIADALELANQPLDVLREQLAAKQVELEEATSHWSNWHDEAEKWHNEALRLTSQLVEAKRQAAEAPAAIFLRNDMKEALRHKTSECIELGLDLRDARTKIERLKDLLEQDRYGVTAAQAATKAAEVKLAAYSDPWDKQRAAYEKKITDLRKRLTAKNSKLGYARSKAAKLERRLQRYHK